MESETDRERETGRKKEKAGQTDRSSHDREVGNIGRDRVLTGADQGVRRFQLSRCFMTDHSSDAFLVSITVQTRAQQ